MEKSTIFTQVPLRDDLDAESEGAQADENPVRRRNANLKTMGLALGLALLLLGCVRGSKLQVSSDADLDAITVWSSDREINASESDKGSEDSKLLRVNLRKGEHVKHAVRDATKKTDKDVSHAKHMAEHEFDKSKVPESDKGSEDRKLPRVNARKEEHVKHAVQDATKEADKDVSHSKQMAEHEFDKTKVSESDTGSEDSKLLRVNARKEEHVKHAVQDATKEADNDASHAKYMAEREFDKTKASESDNGSEDRKLLRDKEERVKNAVQDATKEADNDASHAKHMAEHEFDKTKVSESDKGSEDSKLLTINLRKEEYVKHAVQDATKKADKDVSHAKQMAEHEFDKSRAAEKAQLDKLEKREDHLEDLLEEVRDDIEKEKDNYPDIIKRAEKTRRHKIQKALRQKNAAIKRANETALAAAEHMAGTSTVQIWQCGEHHMQVFQDVVTPKQAEICMPWCREKMPTFVTGFYFWKVIKWQSGLSVAHIGYDVLARTFHASSCFEDHGFRPNVWPQAGGACEEAGDLDRVEYDWLFSVKLARRDELWSRTVSRSKWLFQLVGKVMSFMPNELSWSWRPLFSSPCIQGHVLGDVTWALNFVYVPCVVIFRVLKLLLMAAGFVLVPAVKFVLVPVVGAILTVLLSVLQFLVDCVVVAVLSCIDTLMWLFAYASNLPSLFPMLFLQKFAGWARYVSELPRIWLMNHFWGFSGFAHPPAGFAALVAYELISVLVLVLWLIGMLFFALVFALSYILCLAIAAAILLVGVALFALFMVPLILCWLPLQLVQAIWWAGIILQSLVWTVVMAGTLPLWPFYIYGHYLTEGSGAFRCSKIICGESFGTLPKLAGPVAGVAVLVLGFALTVLKQFATRAEEIPEYTESRLLDKLSDVNEELVTSDKEILVYARAVIVAHYYEWRLVGWWGPVPLYDLFKKETPQRRSISPGSKEHLIQLCNSYVVQEIEGYEIGNELKSLTLYFRPESKAVYQAEDVAGVNDLVPNKNALRRAYDSFRKFLKHLGHYGTCIKDAVVPCSDNYSDMSQSVNFLSKGQPFFFSMNVLGILWNVICGLVVNPPPNYRQEVWWAVDIVGRVFQADVMEAAQQMMRTGNKTKLYFEKVAIQAATENLMNSIVVIYALLHLEFLDASKMLAAAGDVAVGLGIDRIQAEFVACFILSSGDVGLISSFCLSLMSLKAGIGEAPQWREHFLSDNKDPKSKWAPSTSISYMRFFEAVSVCITLAVLTFCVPYGVLYAGGLAIALATSVPVIAPVIAHAILSNENRLGCPSLPHAYEALGGGVSSVIMAITFPFHPFMYIWPHLFSPFRQSLKERRGMVIWFYTVRCVALWATWFFILHYCRDLIPLDMETMISTKEKVMAMPGEVRWLPWAEFNSYTLRGPCFARVAAPMSFGDIVPMVSTSIIMLGALSSFLMPPLVILCVISNEHDPSDNSPMSEKPMSEKPNEQNASDSANEQNASDSASEQDASDSAIFEKLYEEDASRSTGEPEFGGRPAEARGKKKGLLSRLKRWR